MVPRHSSVAQNNNPASMQDLLQRYRHAAVNRLESLGTIETGCGSFDIAGHSISFAADPGCETFNDDFIAVWMPKQAGSINWAAAVAFVVRR